MVDSRFVASPAATQCLTSFALAGENYQPAGTSRAIWPLCAGKGRGSKNASSGRKESILLSGGRPQMSEAAYDALLASGERTPSSTGLLTTGDPDVERDRALMDKLGISAQPGIAD
jgi:hypothetical protein